MNRLSTICFNPSKKTAAEWHRKSARRHTYSKPAEFPMRRFSRIGAAIAMSIAVTSGLAVTAAADSLAEPRLALVWGGFWTGPRHIADLVVYEDGRVIYRDRLSDTV